MHSLSPPEDAGAVSKATAVVATLMFTADNVVDVVTVLVSFGSSPLLGSGNFNRKVQKTCTKLYFDIQTNRVTFFSKAILAILPFLFN